MKHWCLWLLLVISPGLMAKTIHLQGRSDEISLPQTVITNVLTRLGHSYEFPYDNGADISVNRLIADVKSGEVDFMWLMSTPELEQEYQAVYFPIYRGILGMRVGLVKGGAQSSLAHVDNLSHLQRLPIGQGKNWADTAILQANGMNVVQAPKYVSLFHMLEGERFEVFPRGLFEAWPETERFSELNLAVDEHLLIKYKAPMYFFTRKGNEALVAEIYAELEKMVLSGEYKALFYSDENIKTGLAKADLKNRTVIELDNPNLTSRAPLDKTEFWFQMGELE